MVRQEFSLLQLLKEIKTDFDEQARRKDPLLDHIAYKIELAEYTSKRWKEYNAHDKEAKQRKKEIIQYSEKTRV